MSFTTTDSSGEGWKVLADRVKGVYIAEYHRKKSCTCAMRMNRQDARLLIFLNIVLTKHRIMVGGYAQFRQAGNSIDQGLLNLTQSVEELFNHIDRKNYKIKLLLEPCDSKIDAFHLIGPYSRTLEFVKNLREKGLPLELTMDTAHTVEEGEDFLEALTAVKEYCNQIHFANCYLKNPADELYGDKHLGFEYPDTEWTVPALEELFTELEKLYANDEPLRIGLEVLCRTDDPYDYFEDTWSSLPFLHKEE